MKQKNNMDKSVAIAIVNQKTRLTLNNTNTIFSNINSTKDVWWFVPKNSRFMNDFYLLLNNSASKRIHYFFIPGGTIKNPEKIFRQRLDRGASHIEICKNDKEFRDRFKKGFSFCDYLQGEVSY